MILRRTLRVKNRLSILFYLFGALNLVAQVRENMDKPLDVIIASVNSDNPKYNPVEGSPYLQEDFLPVKINNIQKTRFVRFDAANNRIEIKTDDNKIGNLSLNENYIIGLLNGSGKVYETLLYTNENGTIETSFFEVVHRDENFTLYLKERIKFIKSTGKREAYEDGKTDKYVKIKNLFYANTPNAINLIEIPQKTKELPRFFKNDSRALEKYIKAEKLKLKDKQDLIKILEFYHTKS